MAIEPVKIPQNVYIEDRIVGPLTLKQTIMMTLGGGFSYALYASLQKTYGNPGIPLTILAWTPCAIAVFFAVVKINDLSLLRICLLLIERMHKSAIRTWAPRRGISINIRMGTVKPQDELAKVQKVTAKEKRTHSTIQELSSVVDAHYVPTEDEVTVSPVSPAPPVTVIEPATTPPELPAESDAPSRPSFPVDPSRVQADGAGPAGLSDLSIFRDVFSPGK